MSIRNSSSHMKEPKRDVCSDNESINPNDIRPQSTHSEDANKTNVTNVDNNNISRKSFRDRSKTIKHDENAIDWETVGEILWGNDFFTDQDVLNEALDKLELYCFNEKIDMQTLKKQLSVAVGNDTEKHCILTKCLMKMKWNQAKRSAFYELLLHKYISLDDSIPICNTKKSLSEEKTVYFSADTTQPKQILNSSNSADSQYVQLATTDDDEKDDLMEMISTKQLQCHNNHILSLQNEERINCQQCGHHYQNNTQWYNCQKQCGPICWQCVNNKKETWLSTEITLEEINVSEQYFKIEGWLTVFWQDTKIDSHIKNKIEIITEAMNIPEEKIKYVQLTEIIDEMSTSYQFPFYFSHSTNTFTPFLNTMEYELIGVNINPVELHYSLKHCAFKLQIHFRAKLYECFENNFNEFPFEWQFLNMQLVYNENKYAFKARLPHFVQKAFYFERRQSQVAWSHCILARKRDNVYEWRLIEPLVDLRTVEERKEDYGHEFFFSLIKLRVKRNPHYHLSYIVVPLFLMGLCAFAVFMITTVDGIGDRLSYLVTLLLTVAAFQFSASNDLPYPSQLTLIDKYFLLAYFILSALVLECVFVEVAERYGYDEDLLDLISCVILASFWLTYSLKFLWKFLYYKRSVDGKYCDCVCGFQRDFCAGGARTKQMKYWMLMEYEESCAWDQSNTLKSKSKTAEWIYGSAGDLLTRDVINGKKRKYYTCQYGRCYEWDYDKENWISVESNDRMVEGIENVKQEIAPPQRSARHSSVVYEKRVAYKDLIQPECVKIKQQQKKRKMTHASDHKLAV